MPRDGSVTLSEVDAPPCGRRGRYAVAGLMAQHSDAKLTDLLLDLARCEKARSLSIHDLCKARYEALVSGFPADRHPAATGQPLGFLEPWGSG